MPVVSLKGLPELIAAKQPASTNLLTRCLLPSLLHQRRVLQGVSMATGGVCALDELSAPLSLPIMHTSSMPLPCRAFLSPQGAGADFCAGLLQLLPVRCSVCRSRWRGAVRCQ